MLDKINSLYCYHISVYAFMLSHFFFQSLKDFHHKIPSNKFLVFLTAGGQWPWEVFALAFSTSDLKVKNKKKKYHKNEVCRL